jgi:hypothetical protein
MCDAERRGAADMAGNCGSVGSGHNLLHMATGMMTEIAYDPIA